MVARDGRREVRSGESSDGGRVRAGGGEDPAPMTCRGSFILLTFALVAAAREAVAAAPPRVETHEVESEFQNGKQVIQVILPDGYSTARKYRTLYLLPVAKGAGKHSDIATDIVVHS